jgi:hypothetical protein
MKMKRMMAFFTATMVVGGSMLVGCGTDTEKTTSGGTPVTPIAFENLSTELSKNYCALAFSCCTPMEQTELFGSFPMPPKTEEECVTTFKEFYDMFVTTGLKAGLDAGRLKYDGALAASCLAKVDGECSALGSSGLTAVDPTCDTVFSGLVADGGECAQDNECATKGSFCAIPQGMMLGKCQPLPKEGEVCPSYQCADGLVCGSVNMVDTCIKPVADGQACSGSLECVSEYCDFMTSKCAQKKAIGDACGISYECKDSYCDSQTMKCTALKADGAACMFSDECESFDCDMAAKTCGSGAPQCDGM